MNTIPDDAAAYKETRTFTEADVPAALLRDHDTKAGTWGRIEIEAGALRYRILEGGAAGAYDLDPQTPGVVEPRVRHRVELVGPVRFKVVFLRRPG